MKKLLIYSILLLFSGGLYAKIPENYYAATNGKNKAELKTALYNIIKSANVLEYGSGEGKTWSGFVVTDMRPDGTVWDMYSDKIYFFDGTNSVSGMNIEHSLPKSWWGGTKNQAYCDLHHLNPADETANIQKSNNTMGIVTHELTFDNGVIKKGKSYCGTSSLHTVWEPADEYKGDFARVYMYMVTCYENFFKQDMWYPSYTMYQFNNSIATYPVFTDWSLSFLLDWNRQDPVSTKELNRNEAVFGIQGNRNPFIDCPLLAEYIWGNKKNENFSAQLISGEAFLTEPLDGTLFSLKNAVVNETEVVEIPIKGNNLTQPLNVTISGAAKDKFTLSPTTFSANDVKNGCKLKVAYHSETLTNDTVQITLTNGELTNSVHLTIAAQTNDTFKFLKTNTSEHSFTINWLPSFDATNYKVSVFNLKHIGEQGEVVKIDEDFIPSTLPTGWSKTSTGVDLSQYSEVRLASGSNLGTITTPRINIATDSVQVEVRAKTYGSDKNPTLTVTNGSTQLAVFSTKADFETFSIKFSAKNLSSIQLSFTAQKGKRVVIDRIRITAKEAVESRVLLENYPKIETENSHKVSNLEEKKIYYFTVQPQGGSNTKIYGPVEVCTIEDDIQNTHKSLFHWRKENNFLLLENLQSGDNIMLVDLSGKILYQKKTPNHEAKIQLNNLIGCVLLFVNDNCVKIVRD